MLHRWFHGEWIKGRFSLQGADRDGFFLFEGMLISFFGDVILESAKRI